MSAPAGGLVALTFVTLQDTTRTAILCTTHVGRYRRALVDVGLPAPLSAEPIAGKRLRCRNCYGRGAE